MPTSETEIPTLHEDVTPTIRRFLEATPEERQAIEDRQKQRDEESKASEAKQRLAEVAGQLGPRYSRPRCSLEAFEIYHPEQSKIVQRVRELASDISASIADGQNVIFFGPVGTGKDHLLAHLLYAAAETLHRCRWVNGLELYGQWRDQMDDGTSERGMLVTFTAPQVLAISDPIPPVGSPSAWNVGQLYRIIDKRYRALKPTWMTVNAASVADANETLSAPLFDRLRHGAALIPCFWGSYRQRIITP